MTAVCWINVGGGYCNRRPFLRKSQYISIPTGSLRKQSLRRESGRRSDEVDILSPIGSPPRYAMFFKHGRQLTDTVSRYEAIVTD